MQRPGGLAILCLGRRALTECAAGGCRDLPLGQIGKCIKRVLGNADKTRPDALK